MLILSDLDITLGGFHLAADLTVKRGRKVAILGPSGAGKSTLLAAIAGFQPATGAVIWDGQDMTFLPPAKRPVSILFQDNNLLPHLTAAQNVGLGLKPSLRLSAEEKARVQVSLAQVGLEGLADRKPAALSGGQAARVALARAVLRDRPVMLLDEPFGALGPALRAEMLDLVDRLATENGITVLMVSHEPDDARRIADEVILVAEGVAAAPVPTEDIFANPPEALRDYLGA